MSVSLIVATVILVPLIAYLSKKIYLHYTFWQRQGVSCRPGMNFQFPFMPPHEFFTQQTEKYGIVHGGYDFNRKYLSINDPRIIRELTTKQFGDFSMRSSIHLGSTDVKKGLFWIDGGEDWKRIRSFVTPAFTSGKLKTMMEPIAAISEKFIAHLRKHAQAGDEFDIKRYIGGFVMDVITECAYGIKVDSISTPNDPVVVHARKVLSTDMGASFVWSYLTPKFAKFLGVEPFNMDSVRFFRKLNNEIIEHRLKVIAEGGGAKKCKDLYGMMLENLVAENKEGTPLEKGNGLTRSEIFGQGMTFIIGGFDSTHATFDHAINHLCEHPEWQESLYHELVEADVKEKGFDYETLKRLPILNAIINETLRVTPAVISFNREAIRDCYLLETGIKVEKNTIITMQPYVMHRNPEFFPNPNEFRPDRFLDDPTLESHFAYMPFGHGHRVCIGLRFAMNELRLGIANLILNFHFQHGPNAKMEYYNANVIFGPKALMVKITER